VTLFGLGTRAHPTGCSARPDPGEPFDASLVVPWHDDRVTPRQDAGRRAAHELTDVDDQALGPMLNRAFSKHTQCFLEVLIGHVLRPGEPGELDKLFRLEVDN